ncbi:hypothetical protein Tco_1239960, partial [Tanacetum coccineum]
IPPPTTKVPDPSVDVVVIDEFEGSTTCVVFVAMVGWIYFVDTCLALCDYKMLCNLISPLWAANVLLHLCVYYLVTAIRCWIVVGKIDPCLGGAARRLACSHGGAHTLISCSAMLTFLAPRSVYAYVALC